MRVINAHNVADAWHQAKALLSQEGYAMESRAGDVIVHPMPVTTVYQNPMLRVLMDPVRDANPFFHLMEALWMLAGRNDVAWIKRFNARMVEYSDDGETFHGAYGYRWRNYFDMEGGAEDEFTDQLAKAIACLKADPKSRRVVVQMWDPRADLWSPSEVERRGSVPKDLPCNTAIYFDCRQGALNMTVTNRSNDIVWGCYGANVVHMSVLQEYMAAMIGVPLGWYCQVSNNWHAYRSIWDKQTFNEHSPVYEGTAYPLIHNPSAFPFDLTKFVELVEDDEAPNLTLAGMFRNPFFNTVALPMLMAWRAYKSKDFRLAERWLSKMPNDCDWYLACRQWLAKREQGTSSVQGDAVLGQ